MSTKEDKIVAGVAVAGAGLVLTGLVMELWDRQAKAKAAAALAKANAETEQRHHFILGALRQVCIALNVPVPPLARTSTVHNFAAGQGTVYYNDRWAAEVLVRSCTDFVCEEARVIGILGHELGHLLHNDAYTPGACQRNHRQELRADVVSGWVMAVLGIPRKHLQDVWMELSKEGECSHPPGRRRFQAIEHGFNLACARRHWSWLEAALIEGSP